MHEVRERLETAGRGAPADGELALTFERRQKSRQRARLASGEDIAIVLPRGTVLRGGDLLRVDDGRTLRVIAQDERVMHVECAGAEALVVAAYHLGNRHVPLQIGSGWLRLSEDRVLRNLLEQLGARVTSIESAFEPEAGAYAAAGEHAHGGGTIHDHGHDRHAHGR